MTSVGHCLTGLSLAALVVPRSWKRREKVRAFVAMTLAAILAACLIWRRLWKPASRSEAEAPSTDTD
jgi:hypothetical protein